MPDANQDNAINRNSSVLIVGDWIVDDYWVAAEHKSDLSTFTSRNFFRAIHHGNDNIRDFCGAGRVAKFLHDTVYYTSSRLVNSEAKPLNRNGYHICGLGIWHPTDKAELLDMFRFDHGMGDNPYRLAGTDRKGTDDITLVNIGECLEDNDIIVSTKVNNKDYQPLNLKIEYGIPRYYGTTRVFRLYRRKGKNIDHVARVDWELSAFHHTDRTYSWIPSDELFAEMFKSKFAKESALECIKNELLNKCNDVSAVVIKDMGKGVISDELISLMLSKDLPYSKKPWYISSKKWNAPWIDTLKKNKVDIRLLFFTETAAASCDEVYSWFAAPGSPTYEANKQLHLVSAAPMNASSSGSVPSPTLTVVVPDRLSMLAYERRFGAQDRLYFQSLPNPNNKSFDVGIGKSSAIFSSLVASLMAEEKLPSDILDGANYITNRMRLLQASLQFGQKWVDWQIEIIKTPESERKPADISPEVDFEVTYTSDGQEAASIKRNYNYVRHVKDTGDNIKTERNISLVASFNEIIAEDDRKLWKDAFQDKGIIKIKDAESRIELWRACTELDGYVCCVESKRRTIARVKREIQSFDPLQDRKSLSGLLIAKPGSGKSLFVERLATTLNIQMLSFNITTMIHREELLDVYDAVVNAISNSHDRKLLVFIDEVNAKLDNHPVYDAFLAPLEDGYYIRNGIRHTIRPCIWIFATTSDQYASNPSDKLSDFTSRMSMDPIYLNPKIRPDEVDDNKMEIIYTALSLIRSMHRDFAVVTDSVLKLLSCFNVNRSVREMRLFIKKNITVVRGYALIRVPGCKDYVKKFYNDNKHNLNRSSYKIVSECIKKARLSDPSRVHVDF